jgi:hypothetical protein
MEPADECYSVKFLESVKYYHFAGAFHTVVRLGFGVVRLPRGWAGTVPRTGVIYGA